MWVPGLTFIKCVVSDKSPTLFNPASPCVKRGWCLFHKASVKIKLDHVPPQNLALGRHSVFLSNLAFAYLAQRCLINVYGSDIIQASAVNRVYLISPEFCEVNSQRQKVRHLAAPTLSALLPHKWTYNDKLWQWHERKEVHVSIYFRAEARDKALCRGYGTNKREAILPLYSHWSDYI